MRSAFRQSTFVVAALTFAACGGNNEAKSTPFSPDPSSIQIGTTGIYLASGTRAEKPTASTGPGAPKITKVTATEEGEHEFNITIEVENEEDVAFAYLDFGEHGVYKAPLRAPMTAVTGDDFAAGCRDALASQGIQCTDACIRACGCVSCGDAAIAKNLKQACAVTCSANVSSGAIKSAPYNGSEATLASYVYNGNPELGLQGSASQVGCSASSCSSAATPTTTTRKVSTWRLTFETLTIPQLTPLVAPQVQTSDSVETSQPAGAAMLRIDPCPPNAQCSSTQR